MIERLKDQIKTIFKIIRKPVMSILPGQLAFSFVLTIIPVIALIAIIATTFSISLDSITDMVSNNLPKAVSDLLLPLINGRGFDLSILVYLITAIWLASTGAYSIIIASDVIYNIRRKNEVEKRIKSIIMTFFIISLVLFMIVIPAFGDFIVGFIASLKVFSRISDEILIVYYILKYPLSFMFIYIIIKIIYTIAPSKDILSKSVTRGSLFTTILWMIATQIYSFWVGNVAHYDIFYGSISNIIILLMWVYILAYIFVIGMILNSGMHEEDIVNNIKG